MRTVFFALCATATMLGACRESNMTMGQQTSVGAALSEAIAPIRQREMNHCFVPNLQAGTDMVIYDVIKQANPEKECSLIFAKNKQGGFDHRARAVFTKGMAQEDCDLKALSCLRPAEAKRIAAKYGMTIDRTPFFKQ